VALLAHYWGDPAPSTASATATPPPASPARRAQASPSPSPARLARARPQHGRRGGAEVPMERIRDGRKGIALTIDDGPSPEYTPQVLRLLEQYRVTATFSMVGLEAAAYPGLVREVAAAGHTIANHTWSHVNLTYLPALIADQGDRATAAIHKAAGHPPALFRAPYGAWSPAVLQYCSRAGMTPLDWSVDPRDWSRPGVSAIVRNIMGNTRAGSIILEHDGGGNRSQTIAALKIVLPRLLDAGYHFSVP
jgi:peptidoglycan/xylan/chitin deacetylase (PgdA/CDA1 family)